MINRQQTLDYINSRTKNKNLVKHMLAVEAQMRGLAKYFGENEDEWAVAGLIHDADYDQWPDEHPKKLIAYLEEKHEPAWLIDAIRSHAWGFHEFTQEPKTKLEWSLYCSDELSGLIIACALVRPSKKLAEVTLESIKKKWKQTSFAAGVHREQTELCEAKLGIKLDEFISICLKALQTISQDLGL